MTDKEILLAMSNMLEPIREDIQDIKTDVKILKADMVEVKSDIRNLKADMVEVKDRLCNVETDMVEVKGRLCNVEMDMVEVKEQVTRIELTQENLIIPRLNTIESCYTSTYERYKNSTDDYVFMKQDITVLKQVVSDHSQILQKIS